MVVESKWEPQQTLEGGPDAGARTSDGPEVWAGLSGSPPGTIVQGLRASAAPGRRAGTGKEGLQMWFSESVAWPAESPPAQLPGRPRQELA